MNDATKTEIIPEEEPVNKLKDHAFDEYVLCWLNEPVMNGIGRLACFDLGILWGPCLTLVRHRRSFQYPCSGFVISFTKSFEGLSLPNQQGSHLQSFTD